MSNKKAHTGIVPSAHAIAARIIRPRPQHKQRSPHHTGTHYTLQILVPCVSQHVYMQAGDKARHYSTHHMPRAPSTQATQHASYARTIPARITRTQYLPQILVPCVSQHVYMQAGDKARHYSTHHTPAPSTQATQPAPYRHALPARNTCHIFLCALCVTACVYAGGRQSTPSQHASYAAPSQHASYARTIPARITRTQYLPQILCRSLCIQASGTEAVAQYLPTADSLLQLASPPLSLLQSILHQYFDGQARQIFAYRRA